MPPTRLPRLCRLRLHRFLLPALLLSLLQHLRLPDAPLSLPLFLLWTPAHICWFGGPTGRGRRGPQKQQDATPAQTEPQLAARVLRKPPERVGLWLRATAAGSVRQQGIHGVTKRRAVLEQNGVFRGGARRSPSNPPVLASVKAESCENGEVMENWHRTQQQMVRGRALTVHESCWWGGGNRNRREGTHIRKHAKPNPTQLLFLAGG